MTPKLRARILGLGLALTLTLTLTLALALAPVGEPAARETGAESPDFLAFRRAVALGLEPALVHVFADDSVLALVDGGAQLRIDSDGDGRIDMLAWREGEARVVAIDEDGDLAPGAARPDTDSDTYVADARGAGAPDRMVAYTDLDGDGDADRQEIYEISGGTLSSKGIGVTIVFDLDDDDRFFQLSGYGYHANRDQWGSDFDGDGMFVAGWRDDATGVWTSAWENPFCFYDADGDGATDEALRFEGENLDIASIRWSVDADGDASPSSPRDYDFSVTALGPVLLPAAFADSVRLRDGGTIRFVSWARAREAMRWGLWRSALLVWDEDDANVAPYSEDPARERWEGVIAEAFRGFPAVGGPGTGHIHKRYEIDRDGSGRLGLYWSGIDDRIHLLGAEEGETSVAIPSTPPIERTIRAYDDDGNGFFDHWAFALGGRSDAPARDVRPPGEAARPLPPGLREVQRFYGPALRAARDRAVAETRQLAGSLAQRRPDPVRRWWLEARDRNDPLAVRAERSLETERYLDDLVLLEMGGGFLASEARPARPASAFDVEIAAPAAAEDSPETAMTIAIADVPGAARAILDPWSRIEAIPVADRGDRIVGHDRTHRRDDRTHRRDDPIPGDQDRIAGQPEDYDGDGQVDLLYFPHVVPPDDAEPPGRLRIEIDPARPLPLPEGTRVDPFLGRSIAIESAAAAFRTYDGKVDLLAKRAPRLILKGDLGNVHEMRSWGIDPLDIGDGPGIGGPYVRTFRAQDAHAQEWIPMFGSDAVLGARVLVAGPLRSVVEVQLARGQTRARRRLEMRSGSPVLREEFVLEAPDSILVAFALPPLEVHGTMEASGDGQPGAIWSFGVSAPGAGALGLAGAGGRDLSPARAEEPDGARSAGASPEPALKRVARRGEPIRLLWVAGGEISGDSSAAAWTTRATALLRDPGLAGSESASPPRP